MVLETADGCAIAAMTEDEWIAVHYMTVEDIVWVVISISGIDLESTIMTIWTT